MRQLIHPLLLVALLPLACRDPSRNAPRVPTDVLITREAPPPGHPPDAAVPPPPPRAVALAVDAGAPPPDAHPAVVVLPRGHGFLGLDENAVLTRVCEAPIERMERNRGGTTVSFRVWFAGGMRGLFKPQQRADVANYRSELAAYRVSRLLGVDRVPPACGRTVPHDMLQRAADASGDPAFSTRVMTELLGHGDQVPGAMLYWVPGPLEPVPGIETYPQLLDLAHPLPADSLGLAADLSALLLFDFLNDNVDRWSGGNILRQHASTSDTVAGLTAPMLFMDNGAAFSAINDGLGARPEAQHARLVQVQRFSIALLHTLRGLTAESIRRAVADDPLGPCLSDVQIHAMLARRDRIVAHADEVSAGHAESQVYPFP